MGGHRRVAADEGWCHLMSLELARTVADAVLYEGYLLYPYRASSTKNRARWQWGVLGPPGAAEAGLGEDSSLSTQCLLRSGVEGQVSVRLRFLQLQARHVERIEPGDPTRFAPVDELRAGTKSWLSWDEAVSHELELGPCRLADLRGGRTFPVHVPGGEDVETLKDDDGHRVGQLVRRRWPLIAVVVVTTASVDGPVRLSVVVENTVEERVDTKDQAIRRSFIGAHLILATDGAEFVSLLDPPDDARRAAAECQQHRCWPVLAGEPGQSEVVLASPIILYDYPEVAEQSAGELFDSTEIDEILTLRVLTLTEEEKAAARATDPRAAEIIDRCEQMSPESMQALHGILRDPHTAADALSTDAVPTFTELSTDIRDVDAPPFDTGGKPWWDPAADAGVRPDVDAVLINGVHVAKDSLVRVHPSRRADAQDLFFAGRTARVTAVLSDVDGQVHVAVVLVDDPAADIHEWYGRYLYFAPEELEPIGHESAESTADDREESRS
jgi:hypothetical protein